METSGREGGAAREEGESAGTIRWRPNEHCLMQLLAMGIDRNSAIKGLYYTGNTSAEFAASYVFDNPDADDELDASIIEARSEVRGDGRREQTEPCECKMVLIVNGALNMGVGKTASQVAHAALGLYRHISAAADRSTVLLPVWEESGEKKIVVLGEDVLHLKQLEEQAAELNVPSYLVHDAGKTEVPADSATVLAIFGRDEHVNAITGRLPLL